MHLPSSLSLSLLSLLSLSALSSASASAAPLSADIFYWPLSSTSSSSNPLPLAQISYDPSTLQSTINSYTPPPPQPLNDADKTIDKQADHLLRIGLYTDPNNRQWVGTLSPLSLFTTTATTTTPQPQPLTLTLHLDQNNHVYHAALSSSFFASPPPAAASPASKKSKSSSGQEAAAAPPLRVEFVRSNPSPSPHLNRAVVLSPDGTAPEEVVEKSLFQKYWWVLGIIGILAFTGSADGS
ncbi:hypothetical protein EMPG_16604 [Blastomyces silverae]|uniref:ER membrane protein complex subunit 10 n=1 Tax=Blastomyces silverae TaxID=2060906 RepID=A0A0H1BA13_9EURO|nr:hypothetical protein EMPG_16604 [Blastomyces silverae]